MTEEEEDAELLSDAKESERSSSITRFDQSPWCKSSLSYTDLSQSFIPFQMSKVEKCVIIKFVVSIG